MATTAIWRVGGSLKSVLEYVENPEKTINPAAHGLPAVLDYTAQPQKVSPPNGVTMDRFVSGVNCHPSTVCEEMLYVKKHFGKEGGTLAYHGYQSFAPGEATPELAHEIGIKLAQQLWGDRYQVLVTTHLDRENHLHSHFVVNTVSFVDGIKYHRTKEDYRQMQRLSDALCRAYGLSVIEHPKGKGKQYGEYRAEQEGKPTLRGMIRGDIDRAILGSTTQKHFLDTMVQMGYTFKTRAADGKPLKYPALKPPGSQRYFRLQRLGKGYSLDEIYQRIYDNIHRHDPFPGSEREAVRRKPFVPYPKAKGIYALYLRYCYELHILQKHPASVKRVPFSMREDLIKLDKLDAETQFLAKTGYAELQQLTGHREAASSRIDDLCTQRKALRNQLRTADRREDTAAAEALREKTKALTAQIKALRKEVALCEGIAQRSVPMAENLTLLEQERQIERKEEEHHELFQRRSRSGGSAVPEWR